MIVRKKPPYGSTQVDPDRTRGAIDKLLRDYGIEATQWTTAWQQGVVELAFIFEAEVQGVRKKVGVLVRPPMFLAERRTYNPKLGRYEKVRAPNWAQSMRLLYFWLKAKLEAVAYGLVAPEKEFLSEIILQLPGGRSTTVGDVLASRAVDGKLALEQKPGVPEGQVIDAEYEEKKEGA